MSAKIFIDKYVKQIKAMNPKYDVIYEVSKDEPIVFEGLEPETKYAVYARLAATDTEVAGDYATVDVTTGAADAESPRRRWRWPCRCS